MVKLLNSFLNINLQYVYENKIEKVIQAVGAIALLAIFSRVDGLAVGVFVSLLFLWQRYLLKQIKQLKRSTSD